MYGENSGGFAARPDRGPAALASLADLAERIDWSAA